MNQQFSNVPAKCAPKILNAYLSVGNQSMLQEHQTAVQGQVGRMQSVPPSNRQKTSVHKQYSHSSRP